LNTQISERPQKGVRIKKGMVVITQVA